MPKKVYVTPNTLLRFPWPSRPFKTYTQHKTINFDNSNYYRLHHNSPSHLDETWRILSFHSIRTLRKPQIHNHTWPQANIYMINISSSTHEAHHPNLTSQFEDHFRLYEGDVQRRSITMMEARRWRYPKKKFIIKSTLHSNVATCSPQRCVHTHTLTSHMPSRKRRHTYRGTTWFLVCLCVCE